MLLTLRPQILLFVTQYLHQTLTACEMWGSMTLLELLAFWYADVAYHRYRFHAALIRSR